MRCACKHRRFTNSVILNIHETRQERAAQKRNFRIDCHRTSIQFIFVLLLNDVQCRQSECRHPSVHARFIDTNIRVWLVKHLLFLLEVHRSLIEHDAEKSDQHNNIRSESHIRFKVVAQFHFRLPSVTSRLKRRWQKPSTICIRINFRIYIFFFLLLITTTDSRARHWKKKNVYFYFCCAALFSLLAPRPFPPIPRSASLPPIRWCQDFFSCY